MCSVRSSRLVATTRRKERSGDPTRPIDSRTALLLCCHRSCGHESCISIWALHHRINHITTMRSNSCKSLFRYTSLTILISSRAPIHGGSGRYRCIVLCSGSSGDNQEEQPLIHLVQSFSALPRTHRVRLVRCTCALALALLGITSGLTVLLPTRPARFAFLWSLFDQFAPFALPVAQFTASRSAIALIVGAFLLCTAFGIA